MADGSELGRGPIMGSVIHLRHNLPAQMLRESPFARTIRESKLFQPRASLNEVEHVGVSNTTARLSEYKNFKFGQYLASVWMTFNTPDPISDES